MIYTILAISGASLGFRAITSKTMIFYFLRGWLDLLKESKKGYDEQIERHSFQSINHGNKVFIKRDFINVILYIFKPIILCSTCMASVHTLIWYEYLTGINPFTTWDTVIVMLCVAFINTILFATFELIDALIKKNELLIKKLKKKNLKSA